MTSQLKTLMLLTLLSGLIIFFGGVFGGRAGMVVALVFAVAMNVGSYWFSDRIVLTMYRAQEVAPQDAPALHRMVEELSREAGIPKPKVCVTPQDTPNAFATGRNPEHGVVCVTSGIMRLLNAEELRGVLAHEIGHIKNRDILIQSVSGVLASAIMFMASIAKWGAIFGMSSDEDGGNPIVVLLMAIIAPIAAMFIQFAISRSREYLADETGAKLSHSPESLASALEKLSTASQRVPMRSGNEATAHMFIVNPFSASRMAGLFSTHPPMEERVKRLRAMAGRV